MSESKSVKKAEAYLKHATKGKVTGAPSLVSNGKLNITSHKSETINHLAVANQMIKIINTTPRLSQTIKKVMCYRILNPGITDMGIALSMAMRVDNVRKYEAEGKSRVAEYMREIDIEHSTSKFNADTIIQNELRNLNKQGSKNALKFDVK